MKYIAIALVFFLSLPLCWANRAVGPMSGQGDECSYATEGSHNTINSYSQLLARLNRQDQPERRRAPKKRRNRRDGQGISSGRR